jgi:tetratricopeptide (TPR) repeat protein
MSKKKRRPDLQLKGFGSQPVLVNVSKAEAMMRRGQWRQARDVLESLDEQYPDRAEVLSALATLYNMTQDLPHYQLACSRLSQVKPDEPDMTLMLAGAYVENSRPILAIQTFERFIERWPHHHRAGDVRKALVDLEEIKNNIIAEVGLSEAESLNIAALHETAQSCLEQGQFAQGRQALEELLRIRPDSIPDLNNLSLIYFFESDLEHAIATAQHVLDLDANNIHALANLTRFRCIKGQIEEAQQLAERLKAVESEYQDSWIKKAEALSFLADDQGVLDALKGAEQSGTLDASEINPLLYHLAGVAAMRLGQDKQARQYWQQALKINPGFELARENLDDSQQLIGQRHAPWAFHLSNWITPQAFRDLTPLSDPERLEDESLARESAQSYLQQHPEVAAIIPLLLDRGDVKARQLALGLATMADTPEMQVALRDFALSQRGPDRMRSQAAQVASKAELLPPGQVRMWLQGEWREIMLLGFEIHDELVHAHNPQVEKLGREAVIAAKQGNTEKSQRILKQALKIEPNAPDLLYNLAGTYESQGRLDEAFEIIRRLHQQHPDYVFARIGLAHHHIQKGELDEAEALLQPLMSRKRFHYSEFNAFCGLQIDLYLTRKNADAARSWLNMWEMTNPDTPALEYWRRQVEEAKRQTGLSIERYWSQMK